MSQNGAAVKNNFQFWGALQISRPHSLRAQPQNMIKKKQICHLHCQIQCTAFACPSALAWKPICCSPRCGSEVFHLGNRKRTATRVKAGVTSCQWVHVPMRKKLATVTALGEFTVSSRWPKWSQPAVTEPWPEPWHAHSQLWPRRDWAVTSP